MSELFSGDGDTVTVLDELIHRADLDELVRHVERTVTARDWAHLVETRDAARSALATGRQLWPIATLANVRLAVAAPAEFAVRALDDGARTFMPGPVTEIIASSHRWSDLEPHLPDGHDRSLIAYERALRGDDVGEGEFAMLDIPIVPADWEPAYLVATYDDDGAHDDPPDTPSGEICVVTAEPATDGRGTADLDDDRAVTDAFRQLVEPWTASSSGTARVAFVEGGPSAAVGALGLHSVRLVALGAADAMRWLAWAGASAGAHGRRRGAASGRFGAWWLLATIAGLDGQWPPEAAEFGALLSSMNFWWWLDDTAAGSGWRLGLVIEDVDEGTSCVLEATDRA